jgi:hypothetical protein
MIDEFDIGYGFGQIVPPLYNYGNGLYPSIVEDKATLFNKDATWHWDKCLGTTGSATTDAAAPCKATFTTQKPDSCQCDVMSNQTATCKSIMDSLPCNLGMGFDTAEFQTWTAKKLLPTCMPKECSNKDVNVIADFIMMEWEPKAGGGDQYRVSNITVPSSCGYDGTPEKGKPKASKAGAIAGITIACLAGAGVAFFIAHKKRSVVGTSRPGKTDLFSNALVVGSRGSDAGGLGQGSTGSGGASTADYEEL